MTEGKAGNGEYDEDDLRFLHDGYTCEENEAMLDDAQGDLNMIAESLARRGYKVDCREHDVVHWVRNALDEPVLDVLKRRCRRWLRRR